MAPVSWSSRSLLHASLCLCLLLSASLRVKAAGNIDLLEPIVRISPANDTGGGDHFGFSVALHQIRVPSSFEEALANTRILVGAPKGTYPGGLSLPVAAPPTHVNETGLVYNCPVQQGSCERIGSGQGNDAKLFDPDPNELVPTNVNIDNPGNEANDMVNELKSGQRMGATLVSSGELFMACAPQFIVEFRLDESIQDLDRRRAIGRCFYSRRNLTGFQELRPCVPSGGVSSSSPNRCVAGASAVINQRGSQSSIAVGAPGAFSYSGQGFLYEVGESDVTGPITPESATFGRDFDSTDLYETYSMTTGNITGGALPDYLTSVPRANGSDYRGSVSVRSNFFSVDNLGVRIRGTQLAEYFGYSVATADLNNDGYDEVIVGAPMYSELVQETGRVYIFRNGGGDINDNDPIILEGDGATRARFGTSVVNIGDVNDDGFEDIAVGAPYQDLGDGNSGKVFIYYGSPEFTDEIADQTILASDVNSMTGHQLRTFGWSLTSGVDVDNNEYQDLLVGAYESSAAVLFRALSVARIEITASSNLTDDELFINLAGVTDSFNLGLCASFSGRGLTGGLETTLNVDEVIVGTRRLFFDGTEEYSQPFIFEAPNERYCKNITVTIQDQRNLFNNGRTTVSDFRIRFNLTQQPRVIPPGYDGNPATLSDLRATPILIVSGNESYTVVPMESCDGVDCRPDLAVSVINENYIYVSTATTPETIYPDIVAGSAGVDLIITPLRIENENRDPAIGATLRISIPPQFVFNSSNFNISCNSAGGNQYDCMLPSFIGGMETINFNLTWRRRSNIRGTEASFDSTIVVNVPRDMDPANNNVVTSVTFGAVADLEVTSVRLQGPSAYNTMTPPNGFTRLDQLGEVVTLTAQLQNRGPSALNSSIPSHARLTIRIPNRDSTTGNYYYLYPGSYSVSETRANVTCDSRAFNPLGLQAATRRKRSLRAKRQEPSGQDSNPIPADSLIKNCNADRISCMNEINCTVMDWSPNQPITITVLSYLDRRFFATSSSTFTFIAVAEVEIVSGVTRDDGSRENNVGVSNAYNIMREEQERNNIVPIIVPIIAAIAALILIVALFCLLFFCGFFRRKKYDKEEPEEMQVREVPPEEGGAVNGGKPGPPPGEEEVAPDKETTPTKDPLPENDIGDASDLQDGEVATVEPEADPDETSL